VKIVLPIELWEDWRETEFSTHINKLFEDKEKLEMQKKGPGPGGPPPGMMMVGPNGMPVPGPGGMPMMPMGGPPPGMAMGVPVPPRVPGHPGGASPPMWFGGFDSSSIIYNGLDRDSVPSYGASASFAPAMVFLAGKVS